MDVRYRRAPNLLSRRTAGAVVLRTVDGRGATLRGTSIAVWDLLEEPSTAEEIAAELRSAFDDTAGELVPDLTELLARLGADGVVVANRDA